MIDRDVLIEKTNSIQNYLKRIHDTVKSDVRRLDDLDTQDIVTLNLQRAIQLIIDIASYIVSCERLGAPQSLKDVFQILQRNNLLNRDISEKMQKMVGFRNIAVHDYQTIDSNILKKIISFHLKNLEEFYDEILRKFP